jgi:4-amino-4-deoxychorismate lyase
MDRLAIGCDTLGLPQMPQNVLLREVQTVSAGHPTCVVKIIVTRGQSGRGYASPAAIEPCRIVSAFPFPPDSDMDALQGIHARICTLRLAIQPALAGIKHLNRLEQVLARAERSDPTVQEGILLDSEDHVVSGVSGNIFLVSSERLLTPRMDRCGVRGVLRMAILNAFKSRCEQRRITLDMLPEAEEVFICNAVRGVLPIRNIGTWEYSAGPITREIQDWLKKQ